MGPVRQNPIQRTASLFIFVCSSLCTIVVYNTAQNRPDNFPSCPPDNHHCSDDVYLRERGLRSSSMPSGILIHAAIWPQQTWAENWGLCPLSEGELGPHLTQCGQGRGLPACQVSSWSIQLFGDSAWTLQTDRQHNGPIAQGEPFYKRSPKNNM